MAYDEALADSIRRALGPRPDVAEAKMFGGLAFLRNGKMFCGIVKDDLMVRLGQERAAEALADPRVRPMDFTGRPMKGYVYVAAAGTRTVKAIRTWVEPALSFVDTLAPSARPRRPRRSLPPKARRRW